MHDISGTKGTNKCIACCRLYNNNNWNKSIFPYILLPWINLNLEMIESTALNSSSLKSYLWNLGLQVVYCFWNDQSQPNLSFRRIGNHPLRDNLLCKNIFEVTNHSLWDNLLSKNIFQVTNASTRVMHVCVK